MLRLHNRAYDVLHGRKLSSAWFAIVQPRSSIRSRTLSNAAGAGRSGRAPRGSNVGSLGYSGDHRTATVSVIMILILELIRLTPSNKNDSIVDCSVGQDEHTVQRQS